MTPIRPMLRARSSRWSPRLRAAVRCVSQSIPPTAALKKSTRSVTACGPLSSNPPDWATCSILGRIAKQDDMGVWITRGRHSCSSIKPPFDGRRRRPVEDGILRKGTGTNRAFVSGP